VICNDNVYGVKSGNIYGGIDKMGNVAAVLMDTVAIQKYVFGGNKLKENVGASDNVREIYQGYLQSSVKAVVGADVSFDAWRDHPGETEITKSDFAFEVGYIGGGNALLFFKEVDKAEAFVEMWTKKLLVEMPGLQVAVAITAKFNVERFDISLQELFETLNDNKNRCFPQTILPKHGITADCPLSGLSAEQEFLLDDEKRYISSMAYAKLKNKRDAGIDWLDEIERKRYEFTDNINCLGQSDGKDYIAIVHIDGNAMGERFKNCRTLAEIRKLSKRVQETMDVTFTKLVKHLIGEMSFFLDSQNGFEISSSGDKAILPIRPILAAGDDVTFITDGRLGVHLAEQYLRLLAETADGEYSAGAGVAIIKTKYPFYEGYRLAEALCVNAKKETKADPNTSWLDFHLAYGGFSGSLNEIRSEKYRIRDGKLNYGPYLVNPNINHPKNIYHLKKGIRQFNDPKQWPRSKVKELRQTLTLGREASERYIKEMGIKKSFLPAIPRVSYHTSGFENGLTPYFDMIELVELYPAGLIKIEEEKAADE
jgi:hypothetical protein